MPAAWCPRIKELRTLLGLSQSELAARLGVTKKLVADWEQGAREPAPRRYAALARLAPTDSDLGDWFYRRLLARVGADPRRLAAPPRQQLLAPELKLVSLDEWSDRFRALESLDYYVPIPLLKDEAAAGSPREISEHDLDGFALIYYSWCPNPANFTCVHVRGDSMSPILTDGAIVAIDHAQRDPRLLRHRMVTARYEDGVTIKWLDLDASGQLLLVPENKHYPTLTLPRTPANPIVGMVAWWWSRQR